MGREGGRSGFGGAGQMLVVAVVMGVAEQPENGPGADVPPAETRRSIQSDGCSHDLTGCDVRQPIEGPNE